VTVVENAVIGRIAFEGNKKVKDEQLSAEIQSKPRGTFSRPMVQSDAQRITEIYRRSGRYDVRVTPEIIEQPNNRVDLIFTVTEGSKTGVRSIEFVGNVAYSSYRLKDVIKTRESNLLSFLGGSDVYDPDRVEADRDLIRRFYLKNGYADVQVIAALTEYDPDKKGFLVTFKIEEGQQYRVASVDFQTSIATLDTAFDAQLLARQRRLGLQCRGAREIGRGNADRGLAPRLRLCRGASARRPQFRSAHRFDRVRRR
jgi:outer membrane protein insertion porin family